MILGNDHFPTFTSELGMAAAPVPELGKVATADLQLEHFDGATCSTSPGRARWTSPVPENARPSASVIASSHSMIRFFLTPFFLGAGSGVGFPRLSARMIAMRGSKLSAP
jgi:hypothetical protein